MTVVAQSTRPAADMLAPEVHHRHRAERGSVRRPARRGTSRAVARLTVRLLRRSTVAAVLGLATYIVIEGVAFRVGYPDAAARAALVLWGQDPSIRIIAGPPTAVDTVGGFVVWDAGLYVALAVAAWAITLTTRLLRGDEQRSELVLAGPAPAVRALAVQLAVLLGAAAAVGLALGAGLATGGADPGGALLHGAAVAGYGATVVGLAALASQLFVSRGAATGAAAAVVGASVLVRMVANSSDGRAWLGWLTPLGWTDEVRAFGDARWAVLGVPVLAASALVASALVLRGRRDAGAALVTERPARSRSLGLGGPARFAWRRGTGPLLGWVAGLAAWGLVVGTLLPSVEEFLSSDLGFQQILAAIGMSTADLVGGFVGMSGTMVGLVVAVHAAFRLGAARGEEASGRADLLLTRPLTRPWWLGGHLLSTVVSVLVLAVLAAATTWLGAVLAGADLSLGDAVAGTLNAVPAVLVLVGLTTLVLGVAPRMTVAVGATAPLVFYVLELVGPLLDWPDAVVGISPFHHLAAVPVEDYRLGAGLVLLAVAAGLAAAGIAAFERRDLQGA